MMPATLTIATCGNYQHDHQPHLLHISHILSLLWMSGYNVVVMECGGCMFMYLHTVICNQLWYWQCKYLIMFSWQSVGARTSPLRGGSVDDMLFNFISLVRKNNLILSYYTCEKLPTQCCSCRHHHMTICVHTIAHLHSSSTQKEVRHIRMNMNIYNNFIAFTRTPDNS